MIRVQTLVFNRASELEIAVSSVFLEVFTDQEGDLTHFSVSFGLEFAVDQFPIDLNLKATAVAWN